MCSGGIGLCSGGIGLCSGLNRLAVKIKTIALLYLTMTTLSSDFFVSFTNALGIFGPKIKSLRKK